MDYPLTRSQLLSKECDFPIAYWPSSQTSWIWTEMTSVKFRGTPTNSTSRFSHNHSGRALESRAKLAVIFVSQDQCIKNGSLWFAEGQDELRQRRCNRCNKYLPEGTSYRNYFCSDIQNRIVWKCLLCMADSTSAVCLLCSDVQQQRQFRLHSMPLAWQEPVCDFPTINESPHVFYRSYGDECSIVWLICLVKYNKIVFAVRLRKYTLRMRFHFRKDKTKDAFLPGTNHSCMCIS